jgi:protein-disulfide isomerase-like protein with CxxC motif
LEMTGISSESQARRQLKDGQEKHLRQAFDMFDENRTSTITIQQLQKVLTTMGMEVDDEEETKSILPANAIHSGEVTFNMVKAIVQSGAVERIQRGRYMSVISLAEAETIRGIIHMFPNKNVVEGSSSAIALRVNSHGGSGVPALLDSSHGYESAKPFQASTARQCFRFLDSDSYYQKSELNALLRAVQNNSCDDRETFFLDVRSCRRRQQSSTATTPISKLFTTPDQYHLLQYRASCMRIRELLRLKSIFAMDAFR